MGSGGKQLQIHTLRGRLESEEIKLTRVTVQTMAQTKQEIYSDRRFLHKTMLDDSIKLIPTSVTVCIIQGYRHD